ncbi:6889_t:CDS:10 [Acaulospora morrowiae]|uniref:DNA polymerase epsilon subunit n=1 Tax=Acaulospora morrowiae TaxID=94023 RepID=A0A9N9GUF4_9GLOM|nr:6889_t:CDS:10 [Acaulospora morrowiae]
MSFKPMILHQFGSVYNLIIRPDSTQFLEKELGEIVQKNVQVDIPALIKQIAKEYAKNNEHSSFVELDKLKTVYHNLPYMKKEAPVSGKDDSTIDEADPYKYFHVINAFDMPNWKIEKETRAFIRNTNPPKILGSPKESVHVERFDLIYQRLVRRPRSWKRATSFKRVESKLPTIKDLRGRTGQSFTVFGMLTSLADGTYYLEDKDGCMKLDLSECEFEGFHAEGNFVLIKGQYCDGQTFKVLKMENPPLECAEDTRKELGRIDFLGAPIIFEDEVIKKCEVKWDHLFFAVLSDVWLDEYKTLANLREMFRIYASVNIFPFAFIFLGNFLSEPFLYTEEHSTKYKVAFDKLGSLIAEFPSIAKSSYFIFVPGSDDFILSGPLPQRHISDLYTSRIKYCSQELVIFREDIIYKFKRNCIKVPKCQNTQDSLEKQVVRTLLHQSHLCPFLLSARPIVRDYDHSLRLYPVPDVLILADKYPNYSFDIVTTSHPDNQNTDSTNINKCHCLNPSGFSSNGYKWMVYYPASKKSELW